MITKDKMIVTAPPVIAVALLLAALLGIAWLLGVRKETTMFDAGHARDAFAASSAPQGRACKCARSRSNAT